jgi:hypothetical protein
MMRAFRCDACRKEGQAFCPHNNALVVYMDSAPIKIVSSSEERARITADRVRVQLKGKPFNRRKFEESKVTRCTP